MFTTTSLSAAAVLLVAAIVALRIARAGKRSLGWGLLGAALVMVAADLALIGMNQPVQILSGLVALGGLALLLLAIVRLKGESQEKEAESQRQRETNRLLRGALEDLPHAVWLKDVEGRYLTVNRRCAEDWGKEASEIVGQTDAEILPEILATQHAVDDQKTFEQGDRLTIEGPAISAGRPSIVETTRIVLRDAKGLPQALLGISWDVAARKRTEEALIASKERFRAIADYTYHWEEWYGREGRLRWVNPAVGRDTGYTVEECLKNPAHPMQLVHEEDQEAVNNCIRSALQGSSGRDIYYRLIRRDGKERWMALSWQPIRDAAERSLGFRLSHRDVTSRLLTERTLVRRDKLLRASARSLRRLITEPRPEKHIEGALRNVAVAMGAQEGILLGEREAGRLELLGEWRNLAFPDNGSTEPGDDGLEELDPDLLFPQSWHRHLQRGKAQHGEVRTFPERTQLYWTHRRVCSLLAIPTIVQDRQRGYLIFTKSDPDSTWEPPEVSALTVLGASLAGLLERREVEGELLAAVEAARAADRAKSEFLATMSHELRTPLTVVIGLTEALLDPALGELSPRQRSSLSTVHENGQHLLTLLNDLLDLTRMEAGHLNIEFHPVEVNALLESVQRLFAREAMERELTWEVSLAESPLYVEGDERRLRQVLHNLVGNAFKFTPSGGEVHLRCEGKNERVFIEVEDNGAGFDPEEIPRLLRPFAQGQEGLNRGHEGAGLGLALVDRLVQFHRGTLDIRTQPGEGSRFTISLSQAVSESRVLNTSTVDLEQTAS